MSLMMCTRTGRILSCRGHRAGGKGSRRHRGVGWHRLGLRPRVRGGRSPVVVHYHRGRERAEAVTAELGGAPAVAADLTDETQVEQLFEEARATLGAVDVCAAVAGVWPSADEPVWELSLERWEATVRSNLTATFLTARAFLREVERNGHGSLVLVGSTAGRFGEAGHADYAAAKSAIQGGLLLRLKNELG